MKKGRCNMIDLYEKIRSLISEAEVLGDTIDESWEFFTAMELSQGHKISIEEVQAQIEEYWAISRGMDPVYEELTRKV
jgi:hypothetical protein